jgi:succinate dehydrogenase / fumarate reductase iron-sulfur subunit
VAGVLTGCAVGPSYTRPEIPVSADWRRASEGIGSLADLEWWAVRRARVFPVVRDLVVDRSAFDRIIRAGGYITAPTGSAPDAGAILVPKEAAATTASARPCARRESRWSSSRD